MQLATVLTFLVIFIKDYVQSSSKNRYEIYASKMSISNNQWVRGLNYFTYWDRRFAGWYGQIRWLRPVTSGDTIRLDYTIETRDKSCRTFSCYEPLLHGAVNFCDDTSGSTQSASILYIVRKFLGHPERCPIMPGTVDVSYIPSPVISNIFWNFDPKNRVIRILFYVRDKPPGTYPVNNLATGTLYVSKVD